MASLREKYENGKSIKQLAAETHYGRKLVRKMLVKEGATIREKGEPSDMVSNALLRKYYLDKHIDAQKVCETLEWYTSKGYLDTGRLRKNLGVIKTSKPGDPTFVRKIHYERAVDICRAMGADPHEVGV